MTVPEAETEGDREDGLGAENPDGVTVGFP